MRTPFVSIAPHARAQSPGARGAARLLAALVVLAGSGCVWGAHARRLEAGEALALEATTVRAPEGTDWHVSRAVDADSRELVLERRSGVAWDRRLVVVEVDDVPAPPS